MSIRPADELHPQLHTLPNGVRLLLVGGPWRTACFSVFVQSGSAHERTVENGISHVVEHMAFKGTSTRNAQRINRDAEMLGAEVNAHTDKDHTAFQMRGRVEHAQAMLAMLAEIVCDAQFPADELERERGVLLQVSSKPKPSAKASRSCCLKSNWWPLRAARWA